MLLPGVKINMQHYWCRCTHHTELNTRTAGSHCAYYRCLNEWVPVGWSCMSCGFHSAPLGSLHSFCFYRFPTLVLESTQLPSPDLRAPLKCIPAPWFHGTSKTPLPRCYATRCFSQSEQTGNINSLQRSNVLCIFLVLEVQDSFKGFFCGGFF